jgi:hypothetical protein
MTDIKSQKNSRVCNIHIPVSSPEISDLVLINEKWLKECDSDDDVLSNEFMSFVLKMLADLNVDYSFLSDLSKKELCSQFRAYQQYLQFNKKMGNKRINTCNIQKAIFNHYTLESDINKNSQIFKTFPFYYNNLPLIYIINLRGNRLKFSYTTGVLFQNYINIKDLNDLWESPRLLSLSGDKEYNSIYIGTFMTNSENLNVIPEYIDYKQQLKGIGKKCLCILFKYFLDFGYITLDTIINLEAVGGFAIPESEEKNEQKFETAIHFIKQHNINLWLHIQSLYDRETNPLTQIIPYPYDYIDRNIYIYRYLNKVYNNYKLVKYYFSLGFKINKDYYEKIKDNFDPLGVYLMSYVKELINSCFPV